MVQSGRSERPVKIHAAVFAAWRCRHADGATDLTRKPLQEIRDEIRDPLFYLSGHHDGAPSQLARGRPGPVLAQSRSLDWLFPDRGALSKQSNRVSLGAIDV
jgi:hypothetical protein